MELVDVVDSKAASSTNVNPRLPLDFSKRTFAVVEQLPYGLPAGTKIVSEMAPVKSSERVLPITQATMAYFERQFAQRAEQKKLFSASEEPYFDNELVISKANGIPARRERISANFGQLLRQLGMPHMRFHDLRHTCASLLLKNGVSMKDIQEWLGHSNFSTTANIYAHLDTAAKNSSAVKLNGVLSIQPGIRSSL